VRFAPVVDTFVSKFVVKSHVSASVCCFSGPGISTPFLEIVASICDFDEAVGNYWCL
jgi:hypothetical protein